MNAVGVDVNTASPSLLQRVAGLNATTAKNVVAYREENGPFTSRKQILKVPKLGPKAFEPVSYTHLRRQGRRWSPPSAGQRTPPGRCPV